MDEALVEHAEHDVDRDQRGQNQQWLVLASESWKACAVPWKVPWMVLGMPISRWAFRVAVTASPRATSGARLKESVTAGILALVVDGSEVRGRVDSARWRRAAPWRPVE